jgi:hypothetical protein
MCNDTLLGAMDRAKLPAEAWLQEEPTIRIDMDHLQESAAELLLRSPRLSVSLVMDVLDISDSEFRSLVQENQAISELLERRRRGELSCKEPELKTCPGCEEWFIPYASARYCSDECAKIARLTMRTA